MAEDHWALFDEEDAAAAVAEPSTDGAADAGSAAAATALPAAAPAAPAASFPPAALALPRQQQVMLITVLHTFFINHSRHTITDLPTSGGAVEGANAIGSELQSQLTTLTKTCMKLLIAVAAVAPKPTLGSVKRKGAAAAAAASSGPEEQETQWRALSSACERLVALTWGWMEEHKSWPHVSWRECYVMAQLGRAVISLGRCNEPTAAMEAIDLSLILGAPAEEISGLVNFVEAAVEEQAKKGKTAGKGAAALAGGGSKTAAKAKAVAAAAAGSAAAAPFSGAPAPLPTIPPVLGPDATIDAPPIGPATSPTSVLRVQAMNNTQQEAALLKPSKGGKGKGKGTQKATTSAAGGGGSSSSPAAVEHPTLTAIRGVTDPSSPPLSIMDFRKKHARAGKACVLVGAISDWDALKTWRDLEGLCTAFGHRTVPIESGQHMSGTWKESPMRLSRFLRGFMGPSVEQTWGKRVVVDTAAASTGTAAAAGEKEGEAGSAAAPSDPTLALIPPSSVAYLAQHGLFDQVPALSRDLAIPDYADEVGAVNAWWGTAGTVTRCHYDSYDNLLAQVAGYKFVRLFSPEDTPSLYPILGAQGGSSKDKARVGAATTATTAAAAVDGGEGKEGAPAALPTAETAAAPVPEATVSSTPAAPPADDPTTRQGNISAVDVEVERMTSEAAEGQFERYPLFKGAYARRQDTVLGPGDVLFIPKGTWHYVRSLTPSISVNFWF